MREARVPLRKAGGNKLDLVNDDRVKVRQITDELGEQYASTVLVNNNGRIRSTNGNS